MCITRPVSVITPKHDDAPLVLTNSKSVEQKQMKDIVQLLISAPFLLPFLALSSPWKIYPTLGGENYPVTRKPWVPGPVSKIRPCYDDVPI
jgi:hypothetical protein